MSQRLLVKIETVSDDWVDADVIYSEVTEVVLIVRLPEREGRH